MLAFKKAKGSLEKVIQMSENGEYCVDIMQQNLAVIGLLRSAHQTLMENHLDSCFKSAMTATDERRKQKMADEILKVTNLFNK